VATLEAERSVENRRDALVNRSHLQLRIDSGEPTAPGNRHNTHNASFRRTAQPETPRPPSCEKDRLPVLRSELVLSDVQVDKTGHPKWTLHDPLRHKYYRLGWLEYEILSRWACNDINRLVALTNQETSLRVNRSHVDSLITMLTQNELLVAESKESIQRLKDHAAGKKRTVTQSVFSLTVFHKVPLINPDQFLSIVNQILTPLYQYKQGVLCCWAVMLFLALSGVVAHWYEFQSTFVQFMSAEGMAIFGLVLVLTNILHEIGHGLVAKRYHCRVAEMGVAFIFMLPVCYCDSSDTWRLGDRYQRLMVSAGGLAIEIGLATIACLLWIVLPDGVARTLAFFVAVTSLGTTLFINLNPFLKFDGYYLLSDALGVENLQSKSFTNFRWQLRQWFLGSAEKKPYRIPESSHQLMNCYAFCTWIYRLILYSTICWMVYQFWFKALGLVLMIGVFLKMIATPIARESAVYTDVIRKKGSCTVAT